MATSSKYEFSSGSPDGLIYPSGRWGLFVAASLERSGSFHEGMENRASAVSGVSRSGSTFTHGDVVNLLQCMPFDLKVLSADQKFPRHGELKRVINNALGISIGAFSGKPLSASSQDELRWYKANLLGNTIRLRDRVEILKETISEFDKYCQGILSRKRSRSDVSSSNRSNVILPGDRPVLGGSVTKMGSQSHILNSSGYEPGKSEDKTKNAAPNKRVRTSLVDVRMDVHASSLGRPSGPVGRDKDILKAGNGTSIQSEEKVRTLVTGVDGWEKSKMRKKRSGIKSDVSAGAVLTGHRDRDRDPKQGVQQHPRNEARSKLSDAHGFRSGSANGAVGVRKVDLASEQNGLGICSTTRSDWETVVPHERRDHFVGSDKERVALKSVNKPNVCEDSSASSPTSIIKMNTSARAQRSSSGTTSKSSANVRRSIKSLDDWEHPQFTNKLHAVVGDNIQKHSMPARSSSPPVAQWVGQRPQKITRIARRTNFVPVVPSHEKGPSLDIAANLTGAENGLGFPRHFSSNASQQVKLRNDHVFSAGLSENDELGAVENKSKDKGKKSGIDDKARPVGQKVATLVLSSRKNKLATNEDLGDGVRRQGRTGRGFSPTRVSVFPTMEKVDSAATVKQLRSARLGSDKFESRAGRPPNKKLYECKTYMRPRHAINGASELSGKSVNDHEELVVAAKVALNTSNACSCPFWRLIEPVFGFISAKDMTFLKEQGDVGYSFSPSTPTLGSREEGGTVPDGVVVSEAERDMGDLSETKHARPLLEQLIPGIKIPSGIPLSSRIIAAAIHVDDIEESYFVSSLDHEYLMNDSHENRFELDEELISQSSYENPSENIPTFGRASNGYRVSAMWGYPGELEPDHVLANPSTKTVSTFGHTLNGLRPKQIAISSLACDEFQYEHMSLDERIFLELQSIGISPENVGDEDEIGDDIVRLEEKLHGQVPQKKNMLMKLERAATEAREFQEREIDCLSLHQLVRMAYDKYMASRNPNASGGKGTSNKISKHAAMDFAKRALVRCHKFEDTGRSCFGELSFEDMFLSSSSHNIDTESNGIIKEVQMGSDNTCLIPRLGQKTDNRDKYSSDAFQLEQVSVKDEAWLNGVKKRESLLDDVGNATGASPRAPSGLGSSLLSGTKGKRSERDWEGSGHNREVVSRNSTTKIGRSALSNIKGERKSKTKLKQKVTQLTASVNDLLGKASELPKAPLPPVSKSSNLAVDGNTKEKDKVALLSTDISNNHEAIDLSHLQLPEMDVLGVTGDLDGQGQDLASWLNIVDDDSLQDLDFMGLEIPMDDLSDLI